MRLAQDLAGGKERWAVLIGAGMSTGAGLPTWSTLLDSLGRKFKVDVRDAHDDNYPFLIQECHDAASNKDDFWQIVEAQLCGSHAAPRTHAYALRVPFALYLTTNLDCLLDDLHDKLPVPNPRRLVFPDLDSTRADHGRLVYLHGKCECLASPGTRIAPDDVVLTQAAYHQAYVHSGALPTFLLTVFRYMRVLALGFSFSDFQLRFVLDQLASLAENEQRRGRPVARARHYALFGTPDPAATDGSFRGLGLGVEPIFYYNPPGAHHQSVSRVLEWLADATSTTGGHPVRVVP
jgi:hypothetical protein